MNEMLGWLLDVYADEKQGLVLWIIGQDGSRHRLQQYFPVTFYVAGPFPRLREAWQFVKDHPIAAAMERERRRDLFSGPRDVLAIHVASAVQQPRLCRDLIRRFPELDYYDTDIPLAIRYAAVHDLFPLAHGRFIVDEANTIQDLEALDSPWHLETSTPPLKILTIEPDCDPQHADPRSVRIGSEEGKVRIPVRPLRSLLFSIRASLKRHDPDLILSQWGDTWLFPRLMQFCQEEGITYFNPNRDQERQALQRDPNSYFTYGQVIHRGRQFHLYGRWHIDRRNAMMFAEYGLPGVLEQARVTGLPVQEIARKSPGAGVTAMQMQTALRQGILVPHLKQQAEQFKSVADLIRADRGGLVYQPLVGLFRNVAEVDFLSMYPGLMVHFNISPETVGVQGQNSRLIPELGIPVDQSHEGLVPATLRPLLAKRLAIKEQLATLGRRDCRTKPLKARAAGLKWLLVVCFGYLGYKNARFGRIEAHEAVTAYSRDVLLSAKETAEDLGYRILHMYVDALWVKHEEETKGSDIRHLMGEIAARTDLPIALEGIYRWIVFLPSRLDNRVPVPNRYFGVFEDGSIKARGIECNRHDTPPFIAKTQLRVLEKLAALPDYQPLRSVLPDVFAIWRQSVDDLRAGRLPLEQLLVTQRVSRASAARQPRAR